jgi:putative transcriptional regulator
MTKEKEITRGESILIGLKEAVAWKQGKVTGAIVHKFSAMDVAKIRKKTKLTQKEFALTFHIPLPTLRNWEQGKRVPQGATSVLLSVIDRNPQAVLDALHP